MLFEFTPTVYPLLLLINTQISSNIELKECLLVDIVNRKNDHLNIVYNNSGICFMEKGKER